MKTQPLYILHPSEPNLPGVMKLITEVREVVTADPAWSGWHLVTLPLNVQNSFKVNDTYARVVQRPGPVVIFDAAAVKAREMLRDRLFLRAVVHTVSSAGSAELLQGVTQARQLHEQGEPQIPRRYAVAVLLVRKLHDGKYWGGTHNKNFMWSHNLAKGRGVDESYADVIQDIANELRLKGILRAKYGGGRKKRQKYALNGDKKSEIERIVTKGEFENKRIRRYLMKDTRTVPRSAITWPESSQRMDRTTAEAEALVRILTDDPEATVSRLNPLNETGSDRRIPLALCGSIFGAPVEQHNTPATILIYNTSDGQIRVTLKNSGQATTSDPESTTSWISIETVEIRATPNKDEQPDLHELRNSVLDAKIVFEE